MPNPSPLRQAARAVKQLHERIYATKPLPEEKGSVCSDLGRQQASDLKEQTLSDKQRRAKELVAQMTTEEKLGQCLYNAPAIDRLCIPAYNWWNEALHGVARAGVATVFPQAIGLAASFDPALMQQVARVIAKEGRAKYQAQFAAGDHDIYKGLTFWSPNINLFRDPRWGRGQETYGEDPYLTSRLAVSFIRGLQGQLPDTLLAAACAKHFVAHSGPEAIRHAFDVSPSVYDLADSYLPAFYAAVAEAKVEAVMGAYHRLYGEPCCGSAELIEGVLRQDWGFQGHYVSDCWAIMDFHQYHLVTPDVVHSAALALNSGCDLNCGVAFQALGEALEKGLIDEDSLSTAVERLMLTRLKLGLLDVKAPESAAATQESSQEVTKEELATTTPLARPTSEPLAWTFDLVDCPEHQALNLEVAARSMVLLRNEPTESGQPILPLPKGHYRHIAITGPNADSRLALEGNYAGRASHYSTILDGFRQVASRLDPTARVHFAEGCHLYQDRMTQLAERAGDREAEAAQLFARSDLIICALGLDSSIEGEQGDAGNEYGSGDKPHCQLPGRQAQLLELALASGKPVIAVILAGSAIIVPEDPRLNALVWAGYPGARGGEALASLLYGERNFSGRLPFTIHRQDEDLPAMEDYSMQGRTYRYMQQDALYPFGFGLGYGHLRYETKAWRVTQAQAVSEAQAIYEAKAGGEGSALENTPKVGEACRLESGEQLIWEVEVENPSPYPAWVPMQLYLSYEASSTPEKPLPNRRLVGLETCHLNPGEKQLLTFVLPEKALWHVDAEAEIYRPDAQVNLELSVVQPCERALALSGDSVLRLEIKR